VHLIKLTETRRARPFLSIVAILIAVFVLDADFHSTPRPILVVVIPTVAISVRTVIVGARSPISTYRTVVRVGIAFPLVPHSPHVVLAHVPHTIPVARVGSPVATDSTVFTPITVLLTRLRLLWAALRLHGNSLRVAWNRCLAAFRIRLTGSMARSTGPFLFSHISGLSGVASLDAFIRFILHLLLAG
jgi:hypothetical protein